MIAALAAELRRLGFIGATLQSVASGSQAGDHVRVRVRLMTLGMMQPTSWRVLSKAWHGVQAELQLPAPAIAVSGIDSLQLWFALAEPIPELLAHRFLSALRVRFLGEIEPERVVIKPLLDDSMAHVEQPASPVPALQEPDGNWSAFVAPDLAPVFDGTPWLDVPPNEEGQAALLRRIELIDKNMFDAACRKLGIDGTELAAIHARPEATHRPASQPGSASTIPKGDDPRRFLLHVMNDDTAPLALRIEAAKALLL